MLKFLDALFAADAEDGKATSEMLIAIVGPTRFVPFGWCCKKQGAISHSSTKVIALEAAIRMECVPCCFLWELVLDISGKTNSGSSAGG